uniref:Gypsy retrotransposon integrase-like protein 1 n=1 Tax=Astyanax mexicanus TaxID=7994 RepID=A0A8B9JBA5_ASTMX
MSLLQNWCKGEGVDPSHALVVSQIPEDTETGDIEKALEHIKALGRVRVRGRLFEPQTQSLVVLCECKGKVSAEYVPREFTHLEGGRPWALIGPDDITPVVMATKDTPPAAPEPVPSPLEDHPYSEPAQQATPSSIPMDTFFKVVETLIEKSAKPSYDNHAFRRLRPFSGIVPTPAGEESLDVWLEQARLMVDEVELPAREKRKRIVESLKGPAFDIAQAVRANDPDATPDDYIAALEKVFGSTESGEDMYIAFRSMRQHFGEKLSDFLRRIERALTKVVQKGGLLPTQRDGARIEQLLRGATESELMLVQLRIRERRNRPPKFLELLNEVREEEDRLLVRQKNTTGTSKATVRQFSAAEDTLTSPSETAKLRTEIEQLKTKLSKLSVKTLDASQAQVEDEPRQSNKTSNLRERNVVQCLQKQVCDMQHQLQTMAVTFKDTTQKIQRSSQSQDATARFPRSAHRDAQDKFTEKSQKETFFCYRCGEDGHVSRRCMAAEDPSKVISKLISALKRQRHTEASYVKAELPVSQSNAKACKVKTSTVYTPKLPSLPEGLVGKSSLSQVIIEGRSCTALMDSGSTVTIIFEQWYLQHLQHIPLQPISSLAIWGLGDSSYPYRGYVAVSIEFLEDVKRQKPKTILALVCPDPPGPDQVPVIIGTNARSFYHGPSESKHKDPPRQAQVWRVNTVPERCRESCLKNRPVDECSGHVKWVGPGPLTIPAGESCHAVCKAVVNQGEKPSILVIDSQSMLPSGVTFPPCVLLPSDLQQETVSLWIKNETVKDRAIPKGSIIAHIYRADVVTEVKATTSSKGQIDPKLFCFGDSPIPKAWKERLVYRLAQRTNVFSVDEWDVGLAKGVEHEIRLNDPRPFRERSRRLAPADLDDVRRHLQDLLAAGIIKESRSPYASAIVVARKKSGKIRMCVDYRTLNSRTVPDQYTVPRVNDALDCLSGSQWFSVLDLRSGYYQIEMADQDKEKTAFICPLGFYQFEKMPQGITGAPATFQRLMERVVGDMNLLQCLVYLDDVIVFGRTLAEHEERLFRVLDRLEEHGLKVSIDKCQFCQTQVKYVGHIVSAAGIATDPDKINAVSHWPQPTDLKSLQSFLGFCGYYRRFIANYSAIVRPLTDLTRGYPPTQKRKALKKEQPYLRKSEPFKERWTPECTQAFEKIKCCLTHAPVLAFADPNKPYILHVDASLDGLGAVLNQQFPEGLRPVAYASRKLSNSERNYPAHQLEFLALKWAVVDKLHDYLYGAQFTVRTDNNPLTYVLTSAKLNATGHRWLAALSTYDFGIQYRPGRENVDADLLSRNAAEDKGWLSPHTVKTVCKQVNFSKSPQMSQCIESLGASPQAIPECYAYPTKLTPSLSEQVSSKELRLAQENDPVIGKVRQAVLRGEWPSSSSDVGPEFALFRREEKKLSIVDGVLHRKTSKAGEETGLQLVLPEQYREKVLKSLHDESGHLGIERTLALTRDRFYWPKMMSYVTNYINNCGRCVVRKTIPHRASPLQQISSNGPLDLVCIDFLSLEPDSQGISNILIVTDHFTRYAQAYPTRDQKALTVAKVLVEKFFVHYGLPARIHSDQGRDFESKLVKEVLQLLGVRKSHTTIYHPQGDPQPERFNRTLLSMLGTLKPSQKRQWSQKVALLVHAYNSTRNDATGYSPYLLMFGREARLPIDLCFETPVQVEEGVHHQQYVEKLRSNLKRAYQLAVENSDRLHQRNKRRYDACVRPQKLEEGDRVLIRAFGESGKLKDKWSSEPYVVLGKLPNLPVYRLQPERGKKLIKTLHRDHLLPVGCLIRLPGAEAEQDDSPRQAPARHTRQNKISKRKSEHPLRDSGSDLSESEGERFYSRPTANWRSELSKLKSLFPKRKVPTRADTPSNPSEVEDSSEAESAELPDAECVEMQQEDDEEAVESCSEEVLPEQGGVPLVPNVGEMSRHAGSDCFSEATSLKRFPSVVKEKRTVKPIVRLSYDELGKPADLPIEIVHRGLRIGISPFSDTGATVVQPEGQDLRTEFRRVETAV